MEAHKYPYEPSFSALKQQCKRDFFNVFLPFQFRSCDHLCRLLFTFAELLLTY